MADWIRAMIEMESELGQRRYAWEMPDEEMRFEDYSRNCDEIA